MDTKNPRAGQDAGASKSTAADTEASNQNPAISQPQARRFAVIVAPGLWRGCIVSVEPATVTHQPRSFRDYPAAIVFAEGLAHLEGWPIIDRAGGER